MKELKKVYTLFEEEKYMQMNKDRGLFRLFIHHPSFSIVTIQNSCKGPPEPSISWSWGLYSIVFAVEFFTALATMFSLGQTPVLQTFCPSPK